MNAGLFRIWIFSLLVAALPGQDINTAWQAYMATNASITQLEAEKSDYTREQIMIKNQVDQLQKGSTWYNAWINKYLLANHSDRQLSILEDLRNIDLELERLQTIQQAEIGQLKRAYENVLQDYENEGVIPPEQGLQAMGVARFTRVIRPNTTILFPDYSDLLDLQWRNPEQRRMILRDVHGLLQSKIIELDSIKMIREEEAELALRLADFHEDLGLQMEADQDAQQRDASGETEKLLGWNTADAANEYAVADGPAEMGASRANEAVSLVNINVPREEIRDISVAQQSGNDLNYLQQKITEYETLLETVDQELNQAP